MADKRSPRRTADPWADSVQQKEKQGRLRDTHGTKKLRSEKDARRREDKSLQPGQDADRARGSTDKTRRGNR